MQSSSFKLGTEMQQRVQPPHEYLRDSLSFRYLVCVSCGNRTEFTCIKCGYCYSCHWKREQTEEIESRDRIKSFNVKLSKTAYNDEQEPKLEQNGVKDQGLEKWRSLNVLGQPSEPICAYYRCHHKFSLHGSRCCRCKHPTNKTLGIEVRYL
jgi:hypothetical protein